MWMPVLESNDLRDSPKYVEYWGIPLVVFRTQKGIGVLDNFCAHRKAPLDKGRIEGNLIRCPYHFFGYDIDGKCADIPSDHQTDKEFAQRCKIRSFFVKEVLGLVWICIENSEFPIKSSDFSSEPLTGNFLVHGDIRIWMDHFLDPTHCIWTHDNSVFGVTGDIHPKLKKSEIHINENSTYPVDPGVEISYELETKPDVSSIKKWAPVTALYVYSFNKVKDIKSAVSKKISKKRTHEHFVKADLITPLIQCTTTKIGPYHYKAWTCLVPGKDNEHKFFYTGYMMADSARTIDLTHGKYLFHQLIPYHLGVEDENVFSSMPYHHEDDYQLTDHDKILKSSRALFRRYYEEKKDLYPKESTIHDLFRGSKMTLLKNVA